jgi:hypothetical protein
MIQSRSVVSSRWRRTTGRWCAADLAGQAYLLYFTPR